MNHDQPGTGPSRSASPPPHPASVWPVGGGAAGALVRDRDWSATTLGPSRDWPPALCAAVEICLHCPFPCAVLVGPERMQIGNDAYLRRAGAVTGESLAATRPELEVLLEPALARLRDGAAQPSEPPGGFSLAPVRDDTGGILAVLLILSEADAAPADGTRTARPAPRSRPVWSGAARPQECCNEAFPLALVGDRLCEIPFVQTEQPRPHRQALAALSRLLAERRQQQDSLKQIRAELDGQSRRFDAIASATDDCIYLFDNRGRLIYANPALLKLLARAPERLYGRPLTGLGPDAGMRLRRKLEQALNSRASVHDELRLTDRDGGQRVYEYSLVPVFDGSGEIEAVGGIARDTTQRVAAEALLSESVRYFRDLAELSPDAVIVAVDGRVRYANRAALELLAGGETAGLLERPLLDFVHSDFRALARSRLWSNGEALPLQALSEQTWLRCDGSPVCVEVAARRMHWRGEPALQILARDAGERQRAADALRASEARYRALFDSIDEAFCVVQLLHDEHGHPLGARLLEANPAFERAVGQAPVFGRMLDRIDEDLNCVDVCEQVARSGQGLRLNLRSHRLERWFKVYVFPVGRPADKRLAIVFSDITQQVTTQQELRLAKERLELAIAGSGAGAWDWDVGCGEVLASPRFMEKLGYGADDLRRTEDWLERIHPDDAVAVRETLATCLDGDSQVFSCEYRMAAADGGWRWLSLRGMLVARDMDGKPSRLTGMLNDVTDRKETEERIWYHANFDPLTGLPNRRLFRDRLEREVERARRDGEHLGLLFIDLDHFKPINDVLGHDVGDQLLAQAARRIQEAVRRSDTVARLGGDEFTVILSRLDPRDHVEAVSQKILRALSEPFRLEKDIAYITGSVGIALYPGDGLSPEELIRKADQAMYAAKACGKNRFSYFTRSMDEAAHRRLTLSQELRNALSAGELHVLYQPVLDLRAGRIVKAEALLRWRHPRFGPVEPSVFIPLAEESGLIGEIGDWVFREAAECSKRWSSALGEPFQIGVNKSPAQFLSAGSGENWLQVLEQLQLPKSNITIEITEGLLLDSSPCIVDKLFEYRDAGVRVAIDDFGTGYSSMAYLKRFEVDYLKIDQSFVRDLESDAGARAITESIIVMAHKLGLGVIAEGIETPGQMEILTRAGCDYGQGFLIAPPLHPGEIEHLLAAGRGVRLH